VNQRQLGVDLFNEVWRLIETREDDERMLHAAHASAYHWSEAPECEPRNRARSEWQVSRVYAVLGRGEPALHHAHRCLEICREHPENMEEWICPSRTSLSHALTKSRAIGTRLAASPTKPGPQASRSRTPRTASTSKRRLGA
jgi:hypothetical protein